MKGVGIRIYDLRENTGNPSLQFQSLSVHNIAIDPVDENYFACAAPAQTQIQVWDCRSGLPYSSGVGPTTLSGADHGVHQGPVLTYTDSFGPPATSDQASIWSLRWCKGKRGFLGALASSGQFNVFETNNYHSSSQELPNGPITSSFSERNDSTTRVFTKRIHTLERDSAAGPRSSRPTERIVSFDFMNLAGSKGTPCAIVLRSDKSVDICELNGPAPALSMSSRGGLFVSENNKTLAKRPETNNVDISPGETIRSIEPFSIANVADFVISLRNERSPSEQMARNQRRLSSREKHEDLLLGTRTLEIREALTLGNLARYRCKEGYLFDCKQNKKIVRDDSWLQEMWTWIGRL